MLLHRPTYQAACEEARMDQQIIPEVWRDIPGFEGFYQVSDHGRVRSMARPDKIGRIRSKNRILKPFRDKDGYLGVTLCRIGGRHKRKVHRLVLEVFVGPCPDGMECCHSDSSRSNNHLSNLRWDTHSSNIKDAVRRGSHFTPFR